jgi:hypothetical protein
MKRLRFLNNRKALAFILQIGLDIFRIANKILVRLLGYCSLQFNMRNTGYWFLENPLLFYRSLYQKAAGIFGLFYNKMASNYRMTND